MTNNKAKDGEYSVKRLSDFHWVGPNMEQKYKVHWDGDYEPTTQSAHQISSVSIYYFWLTSKSQIIEMEMKRKDGEQLTKQERREEQINKKRFRKLDELISKGHHLDMGYKADELLPPTIKRYRHRLLNDHPDPFGEESDPDDPKDEVETTVPIVPTVPTVPTLTTVPTVPSVSTVPTVPTVPTEAKVLTVPTASTVSLDLEDNLTWKQMMKRHKKLEKKRKRESDFSAPSPPSPEVKTEVKRELTDVGEEIEKWFKKQKFSG